MQHMTSKLFTSAESHSMDQVLEPRRSGSRHQGAAPLGKILVIAAVDVMVWRLLLLWVRELKTRGFEVHIACSPSTYFDRLRTAGFQMHAVPLRRSFNFFAHLRAVFELIRLIRSIGVTIVNTHSPIGAAVGRLAAFVSGVETIIYTVHGFYFHDRMPWPRRFAFIAIEWLLGRFTDGFMFVSEEDSQTARRLGIAGRNTKICTIYNGVDLDCYRPRVAEDPAMKELRPRHQMGERIVIGTVGRIVKEKGYREFLGMAVHLTREGVDATYVVVGDSLPSDRDHFGPAFRKLVAAAGLSERFVFTGITDRVADYLALMDIFVLASYREGFPRSILEAMAAGLPVVTTDIRGCREAVRNGRSGYIVQPADVDGLASAVMRLVKDSTGRLEMGRQGRALAVEKYDYRQVQKRFGAFIEGMR
jgi:glycosyltransferase involved in cell wall biosynthesis